MSIVYYSCGRAAFRLKMDFCTCFDFCANISLLSFYRYKKTIFARLIIPLSMLFKNFIAVIFALSAPARQAPG